MRVQDLKIQPWALLKTPKLRAVSLASNFANKNMLRESTPFPLPKRIKTGLFSTNIAQNDGLEDEFHEFPVSFLGLPLGPISRGELTCC